MSSYTEREAKDLADAYLKNPTPENVTKLCVRFNRTKKSIIAKLSSMGVYNAVGYLTKQGEIPVPKIEYVRRIEHVLGIELPGLDKTTKQTLANLAEYIEDLNEELESVSAKYYDLKETVQVFKKSKTLQSSTSAEPVGLGEGWPTINMFD